jgi:outer membrane protein OmpA-like peptidoglycan-associated protein
MNLFPFPFFCLLSAALIGWLVGWLLGRLGKGRPSESLDAELAGKMRLLEDERDRLQVENADLKAAFQAQTDKTNSEPSVARTDAAERNALRLELEAALTKLSFLEKTQGNHDALRIELASTQQIIADYERDLRKKEEGLAQLHNRIVELELQRWNLKNIVFPVDSAEITPQGAAILNEAASTLSGVRGITVEIGGHTDNIDTDEHNRALSQQRSDAVRNYLSNHGVPANILTAVGYGASRPIADNATDDGRQKNRRIEFSVKRAS